MRQGKVTSRFETPFKRETLEALADLAGAASTGNAAEPVPETAIDIVPEPVREPAAEPSATATVEDVPATIPAASARTRAGGIACDRRRK